MSEQQRRHVSALADGEIDPTLAHTTVSALASNQRLLGAWERYHLIGAAMRSEQVLPEFRLISARVGARIAAEPIAPKRPVSRPGWAFPLAGAALVAGVALPSFFALRPEARLLQAATPPRLQRSSSGLPLPPGVGMSAHRPWRASWTASS